MLYATTNIPIYVCKINDTKEVGWKLFNTIANNKNGYYC